MLFNIIHVLTIFLIYKTIKNYETKNIKHAKIKNPTKLVVINFKVSTHESVLSVITHQVCPLNLLLTGNLVISLDGKLVQSRV